MIFFTPSCDHLRSTLLGDHGQAEFIRFKDGEMLVRLLQEVAYKEVWVVTATNPPADHFLELFFLLDALQRGQAKINILFTYFGYARQDAVEAGESLGSEVIGRFLNLFKYHRMKVLHIHNPDVKQYFSFENIIPLDFFINAARDIDMVAAPDKGGVFLAEAVAQCLNVPCAYLDKERYAADSVKIVGIEGPVAGKKILLVDDMIDTGGTIIHAASALKKHGADAVHVVVTHGLFAGNAAARIDDSLIDSVLVTNSLPQHHDCVKIKVFDISPFLAMALD